jgi:hypothetical protein
MRISEPYSRVTYSPGFGVLLEPSASRSAAGSVQLAQRILLILIKIKSSIRLLHVSILLPMTPLPPRTPVWTQAHITRGTIPMPPPSYRVFLYRTYPFNQSTLHQSRAFTHSLTLGCHDRLSHCGAVQRRCACYSLLALRTSARRIFSTIFAPSNVCEAMSLLLKNSPSWPFCGGFVSGEFGRLWPFECRLDW